MLSRTFHTKTATPRGGVYEDKSDSSLTVSIFFADTTNQRGIGAYLFRSLAKGHRFVRSNISRSAGNSLVRYFLGIRYVLFALLSAWTVLCLFDTLTSFFGLKIAWYNRRDPRTPVPLQRKGWEDGNPGFFVKLERNMKTPLSKT